MTLDRARSSADADLHNLQVSFRLHQPRAPSLGEGDLMSEDKEQKSQTLWGPRDVLASSARALRLHLDVVTKRYDSCELLKNIWIGLYYFGYIQNQ